MGVLTRYKMVDGKLAADPEGSLYIVANVETFLAGIITDINVVDKRHDEILGLNEYVRMSGYCASKDPVKNLFAYIRFLETEVDFKRRAVPTEH